MEQTIEALAAPLGFLGSATGAGILAYATIKWVRERFPEENLPAWIDQQFYAPGPTRWTAMILSVLYAMIFHGLLFAMTGTPESTTLDHTLSALIEAFLTGGTGFMVSQGIHARDLPADRNTRRMNVPKEDIVPTWDFLNDRQRARETPDLDTGLGGDHG